VTLADVKEWAPWPAIAGLCVLLRSAFKRIKSAEVQLDGMLKYKSRAEIAEAKLQEKDAVQDRYDKREIAAQDRADRKEHDRG